MRNAGRRENGVVNCEARNYRVILLVLLLRTHRRLELHAAGLADAVLARVQIQTLVLQDLPLPHDVLHLAVEEDLERGDDRVVAATDVVPLQLTQGLLGLPDAYQCRTWHERDRCL